jgi:methyl-accepting chemotaxis protein
MFGLSRKLRGAEAVLAAAVASPERTHLEVVPPSSHAALLQRWMSLADMQQRVIQALVAEISNTSRFVETEAETLSGSFQRLAVSAQQQTARVDSLTSLAQGIEVEGKIVPIDRIAGLLEGTLSDVVAKILLLSKDSMSMVFALDELNANVQRVDQCMEQLNGINNTTNMLALNARIEAERAGTAGVAFRVVANEVRELSKTTQTLAGTMKGELKALTDGIASGQATMRRVATIDMSDNVLAKERLEVLLTALVGRSANLETIVADAVKESEAISADVDGMVTGIQFQDRMRQRLEHVVDTLHVVDQAIEEVKGNTTANIPELAGTSVPDMDWVKKLLERFTMSEMRARFVAQLVDGEPPDDPRDDTSGNSDPSSSGSIELF